MDGGTAITGSSKQKSKQLIKLDRKQCSNLESVKSNMLRYFVISVTFLGQGLSSGSVMDGLHASWKELYTIHHRLKWWNAKKYWTKHSVSFQLGRTTCVIILSVHFTLHCNGCNLTDNTFQMKRAQYLH